MQTDNTQGTYKEIDQADINEAQIKAINLVREFRAIAKDDTKTKAELYKAGNAVIKAFAKSGDLQTEYIQRLKMVGQVLGEYIENPGKEPTRN